MLEVEPSKVVIVPITNDPSLRSIATAAAA